MNTDGPLTFTGLIRFLHYIKGPDHWHYVGEAGEPAFENSWENYGSGNQVTRFKKDASGVVHIQGHVKNAVPANVLFTLPTAHRPDNYLSLTVAAKTGSAGIIGVENDGLVSYVFGTTPNDIFGISCSFYVG